MQKGKSTIELYFEDTSIVRGSVLHHMLQILI